MQPLNNPIRALAHPRGHILQVNNVFNVRVRSLFILMMDISVPAVSHLQFSIQISIAAQLLKKCKLILQHLHLLF